MLLIVAAYFGQINDDDDDDDDIVITLRRVGLCAVLQRFRNNVTQTSSLYVIIIM